MKKIVKYAMWIYSLLFVTLIIVCIVCKFSVYYHSPHFENIRFYYLLSVIVVFMILWIIEKSEKSQHKAIFILKSILITLVLVLTMPYSVSTAFYNGNIYSNNTIVENKDNKILVRQYSMVRTGYISVYKQYLNVFIAEKEKIELGNEVSAEINNIILDDEGKLSISCTLYTEYNNATENVVYKVEIE